MPITKNAKKANRASVRKKKYNDRRKEEYRGTIKQIKKLVGDKKTDEAKKLLPSAYKAIDKAAKGKTIKWGNADRKKSRLTKLVEKASA